MKRIILALTASAAVAASAGAALAAGGVSYLGLNEDVSNRGTIEFSTVRAADAGVIEILDLKGNLIATKDVKAGAYLLEVGTARRPPGAGPGTTPTPRFWNTRSLPIVMPSTTCRGAKAAEWVWSQYQALAGLLWPEITTSAAWPRAVSVC